LAVIENLFFDELWVLILGIFSPPVHRYKAIPGFY
jgi:hypothetical protein